MTAAAKLACVALVALAACGAAPPAPIQTVDPNDPAAVADDGPREDDLRLTVLDHGAAPRTQLRYKWSIGHPEPFEIAMRMSITVVVGEAAPGAGPPARTAELPTIKTAMRIDPVALTPAGDLKYEFRVVHTSLADDVDVPREMREKLETELRRMDGSGGWAIVTPRGLTKRSVYEIPRDAPPEVAQTMDSVRQAVQQIATPLPADAVGVGAKWETVSTIKTALVKLTQTAKYELGELSGARGVLKVTLTQGAPPQAVTVAASPPGVTWTLESLTSSGAATARFDLGRVVSAVQTQAQTKTVMRADKGGESQRLVTQIELGVGVRPTE